MFCKDKRTKQRNPLAYKYGIEKMGYDYVREFLSNPEPQAGSSDFLGVSGISLPPKLYTGPDDGASMRTSRSAPASLGGPRRGGPESYHYAPHGVQENSSVNNQRCYRVLTYKRENNRNVLIDIADGTYFKDFGDKVSHNVVVYDSKLGAESEKFAPNQVFPTRSGSGHKPRVLVAFDCWGKSVRRNGGGSCLLYENAKYVGILKCLDAPFPFSKKNSWIPSAPHFFPTSDHHLPPRLPNDKNVRINRRI
jgi:hypothetical protein